MQTVTTNKRLPLIDSLRGAALFGVLIVHIIGEFGGWGAMMPKAKMEALPTADVDRVLSWVTEFFFTAKSRTLFAFLFGCAFFFQLNKAQREGRSIAGKFSKRMALLFLFGALHSAFLWAGDIFTVYAIAGVLLLLFYRLPDKVLLRLGLVLAMLVPAVAGVYRLYFPEDGAMGPKQMQQVTQWFMSESYGDVLRANWLRFQFKLQMPYLTNFLAPILGLFLLGYYAMKTKLLERLVQDDAFRQTSLRWSAVVGLAAMAFVLALRIYTGGSFAALPKGLRTAVQLVAFPGNIVMAYAYVCGFAGLYAKGKAVGLMKALIPVGQMTLTNYVMHSVFALLLFYGVGLGWMGKMGPTFTIPIGIGLFVVQMAYSWWWLKRFTTGPLEWLWRSALNRKWQPLRRQAYPQPVDAVTATPTSLAPVAE